MALATDEKTVFEFEPTSRIVPTTIIKITATMTAYSAMSWPSSEESSLRLTNPLFIVRFQHLESEFQFSLGTSRRLLWSC
jgi:hypothetical protein